MMVLLTRQDIRRAGENNFSVLALLGHVSLDEIMMGQIPQYLTARGHLNMVVVKNSRFEVAEARDRVAMIVALVVE